MNVLAYAGALALGLAGTAFAQGDVIAERRAGLRAMGQHLEAIGGVVQSRGDQAPLVARIDQMAAFYQSFPSRFPAASLTPPVAQGTGEGQTRSLAAIDANRAGFQQANAAMLTQLATLKTAAEGGRVTAEMLRQTGGTCDACHQSYRAR